MCPTECTKHLSSQGGPPQSDNRFFLWQFLPVFADLSRLPTSIEPFLGYRKEKKNYSKTLTLTALPIPQVPVSLESLLFLFTFQNLRIHVLCIISMVLKCTQQKRQTELCLLHLTLKQEVTATSWNFMSIKQVNVHKALRTVVTHNKCSINILYYLS